jgi:hypothetical protein
VDMKSSPLERRAALGDKLNGPRRENGPGEFADWFCDPIAEAV